MKRITLLFSCILLSYTHVFSQQVIHKAVVGVNLPHLFSGLPEISGKYFVSKYVGIAARAGYASVPTRGFVKFDDNAELDKMHGAWFKLGLVGRYINPKNTMVVPWVEIVYLRSYYNETGYTSKRVYSTISGVVNGVSFATGIDINIGKRIVGQVGVQMSICSDREHLGRKTLTFQPGVGAGEAKLFPIAALGWGFHQGRKKP